MKELSRSWRDWLESLGIVVGMTLGIGNCWQQLASNETATRAQQSAQKAIELASMANEIAAGLLYPVIKNVNVESSEGDLVDLDQLRQLNRPGFPGGSKC